MVILHCLYVDEQGVPFLRSAQAALFSAAMLLGNDAEALKVSLIGASLSDFCVRAYRGLSLSSQNRLFPTSEFFMCYKALHTSRRYPRRLLVCLEDALDGAPFHRRVFAQIKHVTEIGKESNVGEALQVGRKILFGAFEEEVSWNGQDGRRGRPESPVCEMALVDLPVVFLPGVGEEIKGDRGLLLSLPFRLCPDINGEDSADLMLD
jgi:hypothetical protein